MLKISKVSSKKERREFLELPRKIYGQYPLWVPPFEHEMRALLKGKGSALLQNGPHDFFIAKRDGVTLGRIVVGIEQVLNREKGVEHAYFTLFESLNDRSVARALLKTAESWSKERNMKFLKGPVSPTNGDDFRGLLIDNYDDPPAILMPYNPPYYPSFFEEYRPYLRYLAFSYDLDNVISERELKGSEIAMRRYNFTVDEANFKDLEQTARDIHRVTSEAMPDWEEDMVPPTYEEIYQAAKTLKLVADERMVVIARSGDRPIGYFVALPDFNPIIREISGRLFPFGWYKLLRRRRSLERVRAAILFVIPEFRNRGVPAAMFVKAYNNVREMGYRTLEGSSISWMNATMIANARRVGGDEYKHFIVFGKSLIKRPLTLKEIYGPAAGRFAKEGQEKFENALQTL
jgi:GNAT superfamily N-acetyltransferase